MGDIDLEKFTHEEARRILDELIAENQALRNFLDTQKDQAELLTTITENMLDIVILSDLEGNITFACKAHETFGYEDGFLIGKNVLDFVHPEHLPYVIEEFNKLLASGGPRTVEYRFRCKDGSYMWLETVGKVLNDESINPRKIGFSTREITGRKQTGEALKEQSRALNERNKELTCLYSISRLVENQDNSLDDILQGTVNILPYSWQYPEAACARIKFEDRIYVTGDFRETSWRQAQNIISEREVTGCVEIFYLEEKPPAHEGPFIKEERELIDAVAERLGQIIGGVRAQTRLRRNEQKFREIFHGSNDALFIHDLSGQFLEVNQVACSRLGYSREELLLMTPMDLDADEFAGSAPQRFQDVDRQGSLMCESVHRCKDGSTIAVEISSRKIDYEGKSCILSIARDITERKQADEALRRAENYYRTIFENSGTALFIIEADTIISHANFYFEELSGYSRQEVEGKKSWTEFIHPDDVVWMKENHNLRRQDPDVAVHQYEFRFITRHGETRNLLLASDIIPGTDRTIASCIDITLRKNSERELRVSEQRFRSIFEEGPFGMCLVKPEGIIITANKMLCDLLGYTQQELTGKRIADITHEEDMEKDREISRQLFAGHSPVVRFEKRYVRKNGEIVWANITFSAIHDKEGKIPYGQIIIENLTESRKMAEKIRLISYYDKLTGLPNRKFHEKFIKESIAHASRHNKIFAIIYIGLDNFTRINDTLGHVTGDLLLKAVADRLTSFLRKSDFVARSVEGKTENVISRPGGDEFIVLTNDLNNVQDAAKLALRLVEKISAPYNLNGREVFITASMGIALYPDDGTDVDELLVNAEKAMRHTKSKGTTTFHFYSKSMHSAVQEFLALESDLRRALERNELVLYYQPRVVAATGKISGMEALIRWNHPGKGLIPPIEFIPMAETSGLILPIGEFVIHTACRQIKTWQVAGYSQIKVALNVSNHQFEKQDLAGIIKAALQNTMISPKCLELEITENIIMKGTERAIEILTELKTLGVGVAIDDFGTGHSSLSHLKRLPLDFLKIDKSFIDGVASDSKDQAIIRAMIVMAHGLNMKTIAEGVETEEQLSFLREQGCDEIQGYLFSRPLPAEEIPGILAKGCL